jgi:hypothetical protein
MADHTRDATGDPADRGELAWPLPDLAAARVAARRGFLQRRRDKIAAEIERNRRGEYTVPTWVLALLLVAVVAGWAALVMLA